MQHTRLAFDDQLRQEFLDRFVELRDGAVDAGVVPGRGALESAGGLDGGLTVDDAVDAVDSIEEGRWDALPSGLEAIIQRFTRPVHLIQDGAVVPPDDDFPDSAEIGSRLDAAHEQLAGAIPSVGRVDVRNHRLDWVGTAWMVRPDVMVTNRHVAEEFARSDGDAYSFRTTWGKPTTPSVDLRREYRRNDEAVIGVREVLWIAPEAGPDVAFLRVKPDGAALPPEIGLVDGRDVEEPGGWIGVIGYPAFDSRNSLTDQQRIFDGIFNVKRLALGRVLTVEAGEIVYHDATTLGGNSGSVLVSLRTGRAVGLHFGGWEGERNMAVAAPVLVDLLDEHAA
jgi:hypothetical protein